MCRFVSYIGKSKVVLADLLETPENSLIKQSRPNKDGSTGLHADGFGVGWYNQDIDPFPGVFRSIQPAWNNQNLHHVATKIKSDCFLGHIRKSTVGDVNRNNCHPFTYQQFSMVHNGTIRNFGEVKKALIDKLDNDLFMNLYGNTDSECLFALIMQFAKEHPLIDAIRLAFQWVEAQQSELGESSYSKLNIAITNGDELIATRYATKGHSCLSLHYLTQDDAVLIGSESLDTTHEWEAVPDNHFLHIQKGSLDINVHEL